MGAVNNKAPNMMQTAAIALQSLRLSALMDSSLGPYNGLGRQRRRLGEAQPFVRCTALLYARPSLNRPFGKREIEIQKDKSKGNQCNEGPIC